LGNEDNIWRVKGERFPTVKQVEQMVRLSEGFGRKIATAEEARKIMKIGVWYNSIDETLTALGLPPNRKQGEPGFLTWETSGKKGLAAVASDSHPMAYCMTPPDAAAVASK
jgi:hypothetical protein